MPKPSSTKFTALAFIGICLSLSGQASFLKRELHPRSEIPSGIKNNSQNSGATNASDPRLSNAIGSVQKTPSNAQKETMNECGVYPLDQSTWLRFGLDDYMRKYPNGTNLTTEAYAASKDAPNFKCGIGLTCNVGQPCSPVKAPDWYILYAAQNLNVYFNTLHQATGEAISLTQSAIASVWDDLFPAVVDHRDLSVVFALSILAASIQAVGVLFLLFIPNPALLFTTVPFAVMSVINTEFASIMCQSLLPIILGQVVLSFHDMSGPLQTEEFSMWSRFNYRLSKWQEETRELITRTADQVFHSGINSRSSFSLSQLLANGAFINPLQRKNSFEMQTDIRNVTQSLAISALLRSMNAFVTISDDPNPSKKWQSKDRLSYLSPNGTLMNIIRTVNGKTHAINDFKNGHVLYEKYGVSTEYIATVSLECQQRFGIQKKNVTMTDDISHRNPLLTGDIKVCSYDLPVCDLRVEAYKHERKNHKRVVSICRNLVGLPI